jgi:hypothetical protein
MAQRAHGFTKSKSISPTRMRVQVSSACGSGCPLDDDVRTESLDAERLPHAAVQLVHRCL